MIHQRVEERILIATFDHGKYNSLSLEMLRHLRELTERVNRDEEIKGLILTGEGKAFSSGFHLPMFLDFTDLSQAVDFFEESDNILIDLFTCTKPVISAMNGAAMAGGLILAMATDFRIITDHPKIQVGMNEIKLGLGLSVVQTEIMRFGLDSEKLFRQILFFGERCGVTEARAMGIVDDLATGDLLEKSAAVISAWMDNPGGAFSLLKLSQRKAAADRMRQRLKEENWQKNFNCLFDPAVRGTLEAVQRAMS